MNNGCHIASKTHLLVMYLWSYTCASNSIVEYVLPMGFQIFFYRYWSRYSGVWQWKSTELVKLCYETFCNLSSVIKRIRNRYSHKKTNAPEYHIWSSYQGINFTNNCEVPCNLNREKTYLELNKDHIWQSIQRQKYQKIKIRLADEKCIMSLI